MIVFRETDRPSRMSFARTAFRGPWVRERHGHCTIEEDVVPDTRVVAEFQQPERIVFSARERGQINVRVESADGGPVGFTSFELLLIALANCTLGVVMHHDSLKGRVVRSCRAVIDGRAARAPSRLDEIRVAVELDVEGGDETLRTVLQRVAESCPVGNTLRLPPAIHVDLSLAPASATAAAVAASS
jgi:uncharacterized OsmC-like protein